MIVEMMMMIRQMCDYTRMDRNRNEIIENTVKVTPIKDKMRETRL